MDRGRRGPVGCRVDGAPGVVLATVAVNLITCLGLLLALQLPLLEVLLLVLLLLRLSRWRP